MGNTIMERGVSDWHIETMADVGEYSRREEYKINYYPAPTAAELWGILPKRIDANYFDLTIRNNATVAQNDKVRACYQYFVPDINRPSKYICDDHRICESLAQLAIKIKEGGYELNK